MTGPARALLPAFAISPLDGMIYSYLSVWRKRVVMSRLKKITISLPAEMLAEIKAAVLAGDFTNTSEAIRDALRRWRRERTFIALSEEELRRLVSEGRESGEPIDGEDVLRSLRAKYAALAAGEGG